LVGIGDLVYYKEDKSIGIIVSIIVLNSSEEYHRVPRLVTVYWMDGRTTDEFESDLEKIEKKT
jgi:hypothetical protein